jgi:hypothetical protein
VKLSAKVESPVGCTPCDFRRGFPLGEGFNERERAFAERIPALGEGPESSSDLTIRVVEKICENLKTIMIYLKYM